MLTLDEWEKPEYPEKISSEQSGPRTNKRNPHMASSPGINPWPTYSHNCSGPDLRLSGCILASINFFLPSKRDVFEDLACSFLSYKSVERTAF